MKSLLFFLKKSLFNWKVWVLFFVLQFPSLRPLYKFLPKNVHPLIPVYLILVFIMYAAILHAKWFSELSKSIFNKTWVTVILIVIIIAINFIMYPVADSLKHQMRGSDQDDALIVTGLRLISGRNPYEAKTYLSNNPLSPGAGWIILALPFSISGAYFLFIPFCIMGLIFLLRITSGSFYWPNLFTFICMSSLSFWETMFIGSDMFAIGTLFILCLFLIFYKLDKSIFSALPCMTLLAFAATARIVFFYIIPLIGFFIWKRDRFKYLNLVMYSCIVAILLHLIFYFWNPSSYTPLHLLGKGNRLISPGLKMLGVVFSLVAGFLTIFKVKSKISSWVFFFWFCLAVPLFFVSWGDLAIFRKYNIVDWEGANYLVLTMPIYLLYVIFDLSNYDKELSNKG